jgi:hypothetical protein
LFHDSLLQRARLLRQGTLAGRYLSLASAAASAQIARRARCLTLQVHPFGLEHGLELGLVFHRQAVFGISLGLQLCLDCAGLALELGPLCVRLRLQLIALCVRLSLGLYALRLGIALQRLFLRTGGCGELRAPL